MPDGTTAYLAEVRERWDTAHPATWHDYATALEHLASALRSAADVPRLLAAVEAARSHHRPTHHGVPWCSECGVRYPCPESRDITAALTGEMP